MLEVLEMLMFLGQILSITSICIVVVIVNYRVQNTSISSTSRTNRYKSSSYIIIITYTKMRELIVNFEAYTPCFCFAVVFKAMFF